jgi:RNAse (barnase) inhibitor barstar
MEFNTLGWQGFSFEIPASWTIEEERGSITEGEVELWDGINTRLRIKWSKNSEKIGKRIKEYELTLRRKYKEITILRRWSKSIMGHPSKFFHWSTRNSEGIGLIWICNRSNRNYNLELYFTAEEFWKFFEISSRIIGSIKCHNRNGSCFWGISGINVLLPNEYVLVKRKFSLKNTYLRFKANKVFLEIEIREISKEKEKESNRLAQIVLEEIEKKLEKRYRIRKIENVIVEVVEEGLVMKQIYIRRLRRKKYQVDGRIWIASEKKKIYSIIICREEGEDIKKVGEVGLLITSVRIEK